MAHSPNVPSIKADMAKRMRGPSWEKEKRNASPFPHKPRVSEMKGKSERPNRPGAEASAQKHKHFEKFNDNGNYGSHGRVAGGYEITD